MNHLIHAHVIYEFCCCLLLWIILLSSSYNMTKVKKTLTESLVSYTSNIATIYPYKAFG